MAEKAWADVFDRLLEDRLAKPRLVGITMVIDRCHGLHETEDLLMLVGDYIDQIKLSFGTSVFLNEGFLREKIAMIKRWGIDVYPGGTLGEVAIFHGVYDGFIRRARDLGFTAVEISDGTIDMSPQVRADAIKRALDAGLKVISEVGKKDPTQKLPPASICERIAMDLALGAEKVIIEARESGRGIGVFDESGAVLEEEVEVLASGMDDVDRIIWEAPLKRQQAYFVLRFGPNVNLGNVKPNDVLALETLRCGLRWETFYPRYLSTRREKEREK